MKEPHTNGSPTRASKARKRLGATAAATAIVFAVMSPTSAYADHTTDLPSCSEAAGWFTADAAMYMAGAGGLILAGGISGPPGWLALAGLAYGSIKMPIDAQDLEACQQ